MGLNMSDDLVQRPKVLFFDVNETLLDLTPLNDSIDSVLLEHNASTLWFTTMLQYALVMTVSDQYAPLQNIGASVLVMMAKDRDVNLSEDDAKSALLPLLSLPSHPDVRPALMKLRDAGFRMATLTNSSSAGSSSQLEYAGIAEFFEKQLSVESTRKFKPHRDVYRWASDEMAVRPEECMLIAAHPWDVAGAAWAGMRAAFIARVSNQTFPPAKPVECRSSDMDALATQLLAMNNNSRVD